MGWGCLAQNPGGNVNTLTTYSNQLIAAGDFTNVGVLGANKIAAWNGTFWDTLASGVRGNGAFIYKSFVYNNELYVAGKFDSAGTVSAKNIAKWNGSSWISLANTGNGEIYSAAFYNNELYVGGTFSTIGGVNARRIAKWNGTNWQALGNGIYGNNINDLYVYQNKLYVLGVMDSAGGVFCKGIARWDGSVWDSVSNGVNGGNSALFEWQGKLLMGSQYFVNYTVTTGPEVQMRIKQWDGSNWSVFSAQQMIGVNKFLVYNNELYFSGGTSLGVQGMSFVMKWDSVNLKWIQVGTDIFNSAPALCEYNSELYCGGAFKTSQGCRCDYLTKLIDVTSLNEYELSNEFQIYPNPAENKLYIKYTVEQKSEIVITNFLGATILKLPYSTEIDISSLAKGIYFLSIKGSDKKGYKFIKE